MQIIGAREGFLVPSSGLGQLIPPQPAGAPAPATTAQDPLWARLAAAFGQPFAQAAATRIAYGSAAGAGYPYGGGAYQYYPGGGSFGFAGIQPSTLLIAAIAVGAFMLLSKR